MIFHQGNTASGGLAGMDLVGNLTQTNGDNQYVCVMVVYFTKWAEACLLKSKTAAEVTNCIPDFTNLVHLKDC